MTWNVKALCILPCAMIFAATLAVAADETPTIISPTSTPYMLANGIAPNGMAATSSGIFFTQPFQDGLQPRGVYSITTGGMVSLAASIPTVATITVENGITIAPTAAGSGFTPGDMFATGVSTTNSANDAVYKNGSSTPFIDGLTASLSQHQSALAFDAVGSFGGALIVSHDTLISLYDSTGTLLKTFTGPSGFVLQASTVAPLSYIACPGCIFVTAMPSGNINNPSPAGSGEILTVSPGAANLSAAVFFAATAGIPEPESIQFVTVDSLSCSVGGFSYFASGYATDNQLNNPLSTTGAILAWTPSQLAPFVGHFLVQDEEFSGPMHGDIFVDGNLATVFSSSTTPSNSVGYQLEDTALVHCPAAACVIPPSGTAIGGAPVSWNKFNTQGPNNVVWINAHIGSPSGVSTTTVTVVDFTGVTFVLNGKTYALPDGLLIFDPSAPATPSTTFDATFAPNGRWVTTVNPKDLSDEIFFDGNALPVDSNISGGGQATLSYTTTSSDNNLKFSWQWSAAVYTYWPGNNQAQILAYHNSDHAGTPENKAVQQSLIQGPRGGGGSNFTGSWSGTGNGACPGAH